MIIKIKTDLFNASRIEAIGVSDEDECTIQVSTFSGSTYEYVYESVEDRDKVMAHLENLLSLASRSNVVSVIDPSNEFNSTSKWNN
jgi:hypothetical protein